MTICFRKGACLKKQCSATIQIRQLFAHLLSLRVPVNYRDLVSVCGLWPCAPAAIYHHCAQLDVKHTERSP